MMSQPPVFNYLLLKVAARCNLKCTYCYWFRDETVYDKPKILTIEAEQALIEKLEAHVTRYKLDNFWILLHGGEPLLFGKARFVGLLDKIRAIQDRTGCRFDISMTTNGVLIDQEWAQLLRFFNVSVTVSIDGTPDIHDKSRIDHAGRGSFKQVVRGLNLLRDIGVELGVLAVCDPATDPEAVTHYFVNTLGLKHFDILVPDLTHDDPYVSISAYYKKLFDIWYDNYAQHSISIRYPRSLLTGLLGGSAHQEAIGYGPIQTLTMLTDGSLEPLDVLRITGNGSTRTHYNIVTHTFQDVTTDPVWLNAYHASLNLCTKCNVCEYYRACGGGFLPHRWSKDKQYDNVSVYCEDLKDIFSHIWKRVTPDIAVSVAGHSIPLKDALQEVSVAPLPER